MRVLLADDERLLADTVAEACAGWRWRSTSATTATAAMERLGVNRYDVAVLDRDMPEAHRR